MGATGEVAFATDEATDKRALNAAKEEAGTWYHVTENNCSDVPSVALEEAGLDPGNETKSQAKSEIEYKVQSPLPNTRYEQIVKNNENKIIYEIK